jgi:pimeloyl-ACP methyl ester carboxylesterase
MARSAIAAITIIERPAHRTRHGVDAALAIECPVGAACAAQHRIIISDVAARVLAFGNARFAHPNTEAHSVIKIRMMGVAGFMLGALVLCSAGPGQDRTIDAGGVTIHAVDSGTGTPIVLVHGYWDSAEISWATTGVIDALAAHHRVIAMDCRGHGRSGKPAGADAYGAEMVRDIERVLDDAGIERAHIVGHSMGAMITLRFAADHPDRTSSVVLIGAGAAPPGADPTLMVRVAEALETERTLRPLIEFIWPTGAGPPTDEQIAEIDAQAFTTNDPGVLAAVARGFPAFAVSDAEAAAIGAPAIAVVGSADPMRADVDRLALAMGDLPITTVAGADHMTVLERAELVAAILHHVDSVDHPAVPPPSDPDAPKAPEEHPK